MGAAAPSLPGSEGCSDTPCTPWSDGCSGAPSWSGEPACGALGHMFAGLPRYSKECGDVQQMQSDIRQIHRQSRSLIGRLDVVCIPVSGGWVISRGGGGDGSVAAICRSQKYENTSLVHHCSTIYCHGVLALQTVNPICQQAPVDRQHSIAGWYQTCTQKVTTSCCLLARLVGQHAVSQVAMHCKFTSPR